MNLYKLFCIALLLSLFSCEEKDIEVFNGETQIYFDKFYVNEISPGTAEADSTVSSFFFYPSGTKHIKASLVVCLSGKLLTQDTEFKLKAVESQTTALPSEYTIAENYIFNANNLKENAEIVTDTIDIDIHLSDRLSSLEEGAKLVVELIPNQKLGVGQLERRRAKVILTTKAAKPIWWTKEVTDNLLGDYSQKKYKLFLDHIDTNASMNLEMIANEPSQAIYLAMRFKKWLNQQNPRELEDDGTEITLKI